MEEKVREHIIFYGTVQGVGFRYYSVYKARQLGLTGWVRNLYDETVEMEVQGDETDIGRLLEFLDRQRHIHIQRMEIRLLPLRDERDFRERY